MRTPLPSSFRIKELLRTTSTFEVSISPKKPFFKLSYGVPNYGTQYTMRACQASLSVSNQTLALIPVTHIKPFLPFQSNPTIHLPFSQRKSCLKNSWLCFQIAISQSHKILRLPPPSHFAKENNPGTTIYAKSAHSPAAYTMVYRNARRKTFMRSLLTETC